VVSGTMVLNGVLAHCRGVKMLCGGFVVVNSWHGFCLLYVFLITLLLFLVFAPLFL
jgi:hypothetical protein